MKTLTTVWQFVSTHELITFYVLAVMIDQLPAPSPTGSAFYKWIFGCVQILAANWERGKRGVQGTLTSK